MINKVNKNDIRVKRHYRLRNHLSGDSSRPRLNVYRSLNNIYAQLIDDEKGVTIVSCNTLQPDIKSLINGKSPKEQAFIVGQTIGEKAVNAGITDVVFDRGGYLYTGRVKELADGARSAGLKF